MINKIDFKNLLSINVNDIFDYLDMEIKTIENTLIRFDENKDFKKDNVVDKNLKILNKCENEYNNFINSINSSTRKSELIFKKKYDENLNDLNNKMENLNQEFKAKKQKVQDEMTQELNSKTKIISKSDDILRKINSKREYLNYHGNNKAIFIPIYKEDEIVNITFIELSNLSTIDLKVFYEYCTAFEKLTSIFKRKKANSYAKQIVSFIKHCNNEINIEKQNLEEKYKNKVEKINSNFREEIEKPFLLEIEKIEELKQSLKNENKKELINLLDNEKVLLNEALLDYNKNKDEIEIENNKKIEQFDLEYVNKKIVLYENFYEKISTEFPKADVLNYLNYHKNLIPNYENYTCNLEIPGIIEVGFLKRPFDEICKNSIINKYFYDNYSFLFDSNNFLELPYYVDFEKEPNLCFEYYSEHDTKIVNDLESIVSSILLTIPPFKANFSLCDSKKNSFGGFYNFIQKENSSDKIFTGNFAKDSEAISLKLKNLNAHIENIISSCLKSNETTLKEYNSLAGPNQEPYQFLVMIDFISVISLEDMENLEKIIQSGPRCGIYTILFNSKQEIALAKEEKIIRYENLKNKLSLYEHLEDEYTVNKIEKEGQNCSLKLFPMITKEQILKIAPKFQEGLERAGRVIVDFDLIKIKEPYHTASTTDCISIPIGIIGVNNNQNITLGAFGTSHHAVIVGKTGSGKTSLLHTMITNTILKYSPDELNLYLLDFKNGVGFKMYTKYNLPMIKVLSVENEVEFGKIVLDFLVKEKENRANEFGKYDCIDIQDYKNLSNKKMPRILVVLDEYHKLFIKTDKNDSSNECKIALDDLLTQGRGFGIHVILASQSIESENAISSSIGVRIALKCSDIEAKLVLGDQSERINLIDSNDVGKGVYLEDKSNTIFRAGYVSKEEHMNILNNVSDYYTKLNINSNAIILSSNIEDNFNNNFIKFINNNYNNDSPNLYIGESVSLSDNFKISLNEKRGNNVLVIGKNQKQSHAIAIHSLLSLMMFQANKENVKIYIFDFWDNDDIFSNIVNLVDNSNVIYTTEENAVELFSKMYDEIINQTNKTFFMFLGLTKARDFKNDGMYGSENYEMFIDLITKNSKLNCCGIVFDEILKIFNNNYHNISPFFDNRIALNMPNTDGEDFIMDLNSSDLSDKNVICNIHGKVTKIRNYSISISDFKEHWIYKFCQKYKDFML